MARDHLSPKYIKVEEEVKTEGTVREAIRVETDQAIDQAVGAEDSLDEVVIDSDFSNITEGTIFKKALGDIEDKTAEGSIKMIGVMVTTEGVIGQERDHSHEIIAVTGIEAQAIAGQDQDLDPVPIGTE